MPIINLTTLQDALGGTEAITATVTAYVYRGTNRAVRVSGEDIIFPAPVTVEILNGVPQDDFELASIPADCYWKIIVWSDSKTPLRRDVILPVGAGPFDFDELVDIVPTTNLPDAGTALADAYLAEIEAAADRAIREVVYPLTYASTLTPNPLNGGIQTVTLTGNVTINSFLSPVSGQSIRLILTQDGTGGRLLTSTMKFAGGVKTLSTAGGAIDILTISYVGTAYYATLVKGYA